MIAVFYAFFVLTQVQGLQVGTFGELDECKVVRAQAATMAQTLAMTECMKLTLTEPKKEVTGHAGKIEGPATVLRHRGARSEHYGPGVLKYVDEAKELCREREAQMALAKNWKFDTIAVHGLYSLEEAYQRNQGALIEPLYLVHLPVLPRLRRARGGPGLPHPDLVLHPDRQPDDLLPRVGPGPPRRLPDGRATPPAA